MQPKWFENYIHTKTFTSVFLAFLFISSVLLSHSVVALKLEANNITFHKWMNKQTLVHPDNVILFSGKRTEPSNHEDTWRKLKCMLLNKEVIMKVCVCIVWSQLHNILEKSKTVGTVKTAVATRTSAGGIEEHKECRIFLIWGKMVLYDTVMVDTWHYAYINIVHLRI